MAHKSKKTKSFIYVSLVVLLLGVTGYAAKEKFSVHDTSRPNPPVVTPPAQLGQPPSDAVILFDGTGLSQWKSDKGGEAKWRIVDNDYIDGQTFCLFRNSMRPRPQLHVRRSKDRMFFALQTSIRIEMASGPQSQRTSRFARGTDVDQ